MERLLRKYSSKRQLQYPFAWVKGSQERVQGRGRFWHLHFLTESSFVEDPVAFRKHSGKYILLVGTAYYIH